MGKYKKIEKLSSVFAKRASILQGKKIMKEYINNAVKK